MHSSGCAADFSIDFSIRSAFQSMHRFPSHACPAPKPSVREGGKARRWVKALCFSWDFLKSSRSSELFSLEWRGVPTRQSEGTLSPSPGSTATARVDALAVRERVVARYMSRASSERSWAASRPGGSVFVVSSLLCNSMYANSIRSESAYRLEFHLTSVQTLVPR